MTSPALQAHQRLAKVLPRHVHAPQEPNLRPGRARTGRTGDTAAGAVLAAVRAGPKRLAMIVEHTQLPRAKVKSVTRWLVSTRELKCTEAVYTIGEISHED